MMKITGLSHIFKWENLHNWWLTKYFVALLYIEINSSTITRIAMYSEIFKMIYHPLLLQIIGI